LKILSVKDQNEHLVLTFLGLKIKFRFVHLSDWLKSKYCSSIKINKGKNNKLIILDEKGNVTKLQHIHNLKIEFNGNNNSITLYKNINLICMTEIKCTDNNVVIIKKTNNPMGLTVIGTMSKNNRLIIHENAYIGHAYFGLHCDENMSIEIGKDALISTSVVFRTSDGHSIIDNATAQILNPGKSISVGKHCWIAEGVKVLKGANIKDNSILGAGAIYTEKCNSILNQSGGGICWRACQTY
jgi:acetyltransferase-like isoleucine patch superfamily enzyme